MGRHYAPDTADTWEGSPAYIRAHQRQGDRRTGRGAAGHLGRYQEEGKKELVGNYKNGGTDYRPKGDPRRVKVHDFGQGARQSRTLWRVRCWRQRRLGERRDHKRYGSVCRRLHPTLARRDGGASATRKPAS